MNRLGLSTTGRTGGLVIGADGSMSAGTGTGAALAVAVVADRCHDEASLDAAGGARRGDRSGSADGVVADAPRGWRRTGFVHPERVREAG